VSRAPLLAAERGAILIQTIVSLVLMFGVATFVVDYGVLWVGRHQAQNAADAGAMAGAIARAYEDFDDPPDPAGRAAGNMSQVASANNVWGAAATAPLPGDAFNCPPDVPANSRCVRVNVFRDGGANGGNGSAALPTWFGPILGIASQKVQATARARVVVANATDCLRPWAIPDRWLGSYFVGGAYTGLPDIYVPPGPGGPGTGLKFPTHNSDVGNPVVSDFGTSTGSLTVTDLTNPANPILRSSIVPLDLGGGYSPGACHTIAVGARPTVLTAASITTDLNQLFADDSSAIWDGTSHAIANSCAPGCAQFSPRLVAIAVFNVEAFRVQRMNGWTGCPTPGIPCVSIVNIVGFFVGAGGANGILMGYPGLIPLPTDPVMLTAQSSFLKAVTLVR
jgi:hypothetical protein